MKFSESFDLAFEKEKERSAKKGKSFVVTPATAKTLTFLWNMLALAQNKLDNLAFIDDNNNILEVPLDGGDKKQGKEDSEKGNLKNKKGQTSMSKNADEKTATTKINGSDGIIDGSTDNTQ